MEPKKMGRPKKEIDVKIFEGLCGLQCTEAEVCECLNITDKTLNKWCRETYGETFSDVFKKKCTKGKISLRRKQFKLAEKSAAMAIWLGKQYLGQRDVQEVKQDVTSSVTVAKANPCKELTTEELKKLADSL